MKNLNGKNISLSRFSGSELSLGIRGCVAQSLLLMPRGVNGQPVISSAVLARVRRRGLGLRRL